MKLYPAQLSLNMHRHACCALKLQHLFKNKHIIRQHCEMMCGVSAFTLGNHPYILPLLPTQLPALPSLCSLPPSGLRPSGELKKEELGQEEEHCVCVSASGMREEKGTGRCPPAVAVCGKEEQRGEPLGCWWGGFGRRVIAAHFGTT